MWKSFQKLLRTDVLSVIINNKYSWLIVVLMIFQRIFHGKCRNTFVVCCIIKYRKPWISSFSIQFRIIDVKRIGYIYYQPSSPWTHPLSSSLLLRIIVRLYLRSSGFYQSIEYRLSLCRFPLHNWIVFVLIHRYIGSLKINCHVPLQWLEFLELICIARVLLPCKAEKGKRKNVSRR